jgi:hypothetical protein
VLEIGGLRFEFRARAYVRNTETVVLSTAGDAVAGPMKLYEDRVLAAMRRVFRIL